MAYRLRYHQAVVSEDLPQIDHAWQTKIRQAVERRLTVEPAYYGEPLRHARKGYWKLRVGDYRVIYQMMGQDVWILTIGHRREVYTRTSRLIPQSY